MTHVSIFRMRDGSTGERDVDAGQSISDQIGPGWAVYGYNLPARKSASIVPLILVVVIVVLGALLLYSLS